MTLIHQDFPKYRTVPYDHRLPMKIAYLDAGALLDYWVAMASRYEPVYQSDGVDGPRVCINRCHAQGTLVQVAPGTVFRPSTCWSDAGPIIDREKIDLLSDFGRWMARHSKRQDYSRPDVSPLVAAMRAYLMWEYGDEVPSSAR